MAASEPENPLLYFKRLNEIFTSLIGPETVRVGLPERLLDEAFQNFDQYVTRSCNGGESAIACRGGCASCCTLRVSATAPEVLLIKHYFKKLQQARGAGFVQDLIERIEQANEATGGLSESERMTAGEVCPFIENGLCVIYSRRPLACRGHASLSEHACIEALRGEDVDVPVSQPHLMSRSLIQNAMQSALRDAGLAWGTYELNQALVMALKDENCEAAWLAGANIFARAQVSEISQEEMEATFDAIKAAA